MKLDHYKKNASIKSIAYTTNSIVITMSSVASNLKILITIDAEAHLCILPKFGGFCQLENPLSATDNINALKEAYDLEDATCRYIATAISGAYLINDYGEEFFSKDDASL